MLRGDDIAVEIIEKSLHVVSNLVRGNSETNKIIRQEICGKQLDAKSIHPILTYDRRYNKLKIPAVKILTKLSLAVPTRTTVGSGTIADFIEVLKGLFFDAENETYVRKTAGKALALLATNSPTYCAMIMNDNMTTEHSVIFRLSAMISDTSSRSYKTAIANLLMQFCVISRSLEERECLAPIKTILYEVLRVICSVEPDAASDQSDRRQQSRSPAEVVLQVCFPCININSRGNQAVSPNQQPDHVPPQPLGAAAGTETSPNQDLGLRNQRGDGNNQRLAQVILSQAFCYFEKLVNMLPAYFARRQNRGIPGDDNTQVHMAAAPLETGRRKTLAAFLSLAVQMCHKLIDANDFDQALALIPLPEDEFVDKMKEIIQICNKDSAGLLKGKGPTVDYLVIMKSATKLCSWVMRKKPDFVAYFREKNIAQKLNDATEDMRELELTMLLSCSAHELTNYETLSSIVEDSKRCIPSLEPNA